MEGPLRTPPIDRSRELLKTAREEIFKSVNGVDLPGMAGFTTAAHTDEDVAKTVKAVERTVELMMADGLV